VHRASVIRIATLFGVEVEAVAQVSGGFSNASVFRIVSADHCVFAMRRTPVDASVPEQRLRTLHRFLSVVRDLGSEVVPVPLPPCPAAVLRVSTAEEIHPAESWIRTGTDLWQMEPWMPGDPADVPLTAEQLESAFRCLQAFHASARTAISVILPNEWFFLASGVSPAVQRRLNIAEELATGLLGALRTAAATDLDPKFRALSLRICHAIEPWLSWLVTRLTQISRETFALQPIMRDLWRAHVLFTGNQVTGLIDFSAAASDHVCLDLSRLLRSWFRSDVQKIREAAEKFSVERPLSQKEWKLLEALDAATVLLSPVTWLRRRFESGDRSPCRDDVLARLNELTEIAEQFRPLPG